MNTFCIILSQIMEERGITQKWLASASDTTEATISRYMSGTHKPNVEVLVRIAEALSVSVDFLLGVSPTNTLNSKTTAEENMILRCYRRASNRDQQIIWSILQEYLRTPEEEALVSHIRSGEQVG